jgi:hypothetical protein
MGPGFELESNDDHDYDSGSYVLLRKSRVSRNILRLSAVTFEPPIFSSVTNNNCGSDDVLMSFEMNSHLNHTLKQWCRGRNGWIILTVDYYTFFWNHDGI